jgi:hypothetical protein
MKPGSSLGKNWKGHYIRPGKRKWIREFGRSWWATGMNREEWRKLLKKPKTLYEM